MESSKVNLISAWFGYYRAGNQPNPAISTPFISQLGVSSRRSVINNVVRLTFSITLLISAIVSPMRGKVPADRKGRNRCYCARVASGMAILPYCRHLRPMSGNFSCCAESWGYVRLYPQCHGAGSLQVPRERSGWALSTLSTAQIKRRYGRRAVTGRLCRDLGRAAGAVITAMLLVVSFLVTLFN